MTRGPLAAELARLRVHYRNGTERVASGYRLTDRSILTSAHQLADADRVTVLLADRNDPEKRASLTTSTWWLGRPSPEARDTGADIAILSVDSQKGNVAALTDPPRLGRLDRSRAGVVSCVIVGFPLFQIRSRRDAPAAEPAALQLARDSVQVTANIALLTALDSRTFTATVTDHVPRQEDLEEWLRRLAPDRGHDAPPTWDSVWEGMSGAAVWVGDTIIGVVSQQSLVGGRHQLVVAPLDELYGNDGPPEAEEQLFRTAGLPRSRSGLPDVARFSDRAASLLTSQQETVRSLVESDARPTRVAELDDLTTWLAEGPTYCWIRGDAWAGKTTLAAALVLHPLQGIDVVSFFVTGRINAHADADAFLVSVVEQLAAYVGASEEWLTGSAVIRRGEFRRLLTQVARDCRVRGRQLLLIVDGLDEDEGFSLGSIAALLPTDVAENVRILVTSRTGSGLPPDLDQGHPLRRTQPYELAPSSVAGQLQALASTELQGLIGDPELRQLLGYLVAAGGGLSAQDLVDLLAVNGSVDVDVAWLDERLRRSRSFIHVGTTPDGRREYAFAHQTLLVRAELHLGKSRKGFEARIHAWARDSQERRWPRGCSWYLLDAYPRRVRAVTGDQPDEGVDPLTEILLDRAWQERLRAVTGSDAAGIGHLSRAMYRYAGEGRDEAAPAVLARLAAHRHRLQDAADRTPSELVATCARLGQASRSRDIAGLLTTSEARDTALAGAALALAGSDAVDEALAFAADVADAGNRLETQIAVLEKQATGSAPGQVVGAVLDLGGRLSMDGLARVARSLVDAGETATVAELAEGLAPSRRFVVHVVAGEIDVAIDVTGDGDLTERREALTAALARFTGPAGKLEQLVRALKIGKDRYDYAEEVAKAGAAAGSVELVLDGIRALYPYQGEPMLATLGRSAEGQRLLMDVLAEFRFKCDTDAYCGAVAEARCEQGDFEGALRAAGQIYYRDPQERCLERIIGAALTQGQTLVLQAAIALAPGRAAEARLLSRACSEFARGRASSGAGTPPESERAELRSELARLCHDAFDNRDRRLVTLHDDDDLTARLEIARGLCSLGLVLEGLLVVRPIPRFERGHVFQSLISACAEAGDVRGARALIRLTPWLDRADQRQQAVAVAAADGDADFALMSFDPRRQRLTGSWDEIEDVVTNLSRRGRGVRLISKALRERWFSADLFAPAAAAATEALGVDAGLAMAERVPGSRDRARLLGRIAAETRDSTGIERVRTATAGLRSDDVDLVISQLGMAAGRLGLALLARELCRGLPEDFDRPEVFAAAAAAAADDDVTASLALVDRAIAAAERQGRADRQAQLAAALTRTPTQEVRPLRRRQVVAHRRGERFALAAELASVAFATFVAGDRPTAERLLAEARRLLRWTSLPLLLSAEQALPRALHEDLEANFVPWNQGLAAISVATTGIDGPATGLAVMAEVPRDDVRWEALDAVIAMLRDESDFTAAQAIIPRHPRNVRVRRLHLLIARAVEVGDEALTWAQGPGLAAVSDAEWGDREHPSHELVSSALVSAGRIDAALAVIGGVHGFDRWKLVHAALEHADAAALHPLIEDVHSYPFVDGKTFWRKASLRAAECGELDTAFDALKRLEPDAELMRRLALAAPPGADVLEKLLVPYMAWRMKGAGRWPGHPEWYPEPAEQGTHTEPEPLGPQPFSWRDSLRALVTAWDDPADVDGIRRWQRVSDLVCAAVAAGNVELAAVMAGGVSESSARRTLEAAAGAAARRGDVTVVNEILDLLPPWDVSVQEEAAVLLAEAGQGRDALAIAVGGRHQGLILDWTFAKIMVALSAHGDVPGSLQAAENISSPENHQWELRTAAANLVRRDQHDAAGVLLRLVTDPREQGELSAPLVDAVADADAVGSVRAAILGLSDPDLRADRLIELALKANDEDSRAECDRCIGAVLISPQWLRALREGAPTAHWLTDNLREQLLADVR